MIALAGEGFFHIPCHQSNKQPNFVSLKSSWL
jgi:hypothetical protein